MKDGKPKVLRETVWDIHDVTGRLVAQHVRQDLSNGEKLMPWRRVGGMVTAPTQYLYGAELLRESATAEICLVEGEKAADALRKKGFRLTLGTVCGASSCPSDNILHNLAGHPLLLWPDQDMPGNMHMLKVAAACIRLGITQIRIVRWEGAAKGADAHDWCAGHERDATVNLFKRAERYDPEAGRVRLGEIAYRELSSSTVPAPIVRRLGAGYVLNFPTESVEVEIPEIYRHRDLEVTCLMHFTYEPPGSDNPFPLEWTKQNLYGGGRERLALSLGKRTESNWSDLLHQVWRTIISLENSGEDPISLAEIEPRGPARQLLGQLALDGVPTMIYGHGGDGKSLVALAVGISVQTGIPLLGLHPTAMRRVLYVDFEADVDVQADRIRAMMRGYLGREPDQDELPPVDFYPGRGHSLQRLAPRLVSLINREGYGFIIIDSVSWAAGGPLEESATATSFKLALDQLGIGSLCVAHVNRDKNRQGDMAFGSAFWHDSMRATWYLKKQQVSGVGTSDIVLIHKKSNYGKLEPDMGLHLTFGEEPESVKFTTLRHNKIPTPLRSHMSLADRVHAAIVENGYRRMGYKELAETLGKSYEQIKNLLASDRTGRFNTQPDPDQKGGGRPRMLVGLAERFVTQEGGFVTPGSVTKPITKLNYETPPRAGAPGHPPGGGGYYETPPSPNPDGGTQGETSWGFVTDEGDDDPDPRLGFPGLFEDDEET
jgi:hypothetical protein